MLFIILPSYDCNNCLKYYLFIKVILYKYYFYFDIKKNKLVKKYLFYKILEVLNN